VEEESARVIPEPGSPLISFRGIHKSFGENGENKVLIGIDLEVYQGETMVILGRSGSGKTVLTSMLVGLNTPDAGVITVEGVEITEFVTDTDWRNLRLRTGYLFQGSALYDSMTVGENVAFPMVQHTDWSEPEIERRVAEKLGQVGLAGVEPLDPTALSGGMQRRAALARSLAIDEVMGFGCQWSGAAAADQAGLRGLSYNRRFYLLPVRCLGQIDPVVMGRAFLEGANGLLLIGCNPEECHHSYGIDHTWSRVWVLKKLLSLCGLERERIALAHSDITRPDQFVTTVESFMKTMAALGPIQRDAEIQSRLQALYDALRVSRVRWVLGVSLRRPWETAYPSHMPNPAAYDHTLTEILTEEFFRARVKNLMRQQGKLLHLNDITQALGVDEVQAHEYLKDMGYEGLIAISFVNRTRFYGLPSGPP